MRTTAYDVPVVITADQLRIARVRAGFSSQAALAKALGVSERTVAYWEGAGGHVSTRAEGKVRELLWPKEPEQYTDMSDAALVAEMIRMLGVIGQRLAERSTVRPPDDPETSDDLTSASNSAEPATDMADSANNRCPDDPSAGWGVGPIP